MDIHHQMRRWRLAGRALRTVGILAKAGQPDLPRWLKLFWWLVKMRFDDLRKMIESFSQRPANVICQGGWYYLILLLVAKFVIRGSKLSIIFDHRIWSKVSWTGSPAWSGKVVDKNNQIYSIGDNWNVDQSSIHNLENDFCDDLVDN